MMKVLYLCLWVSTTSAFTLQPANVKSSIATSLFAKSKDDEGGSYQAIPEGTFVEFTEKRRNHIGKIVKIEYKTGGGAPRYVVEDSEGKKFGIADKQVSYAMNCPNTPGQASKLYNEFVRAQDTPLDSLNEQLDMNTELLQMAWEETAADEESKDHIITAAGLIELVQGQTASAIEKYLAWKLLRTDIGHLFFKEIKDHGRVVAFKAKTQKAVNDALRAFCQSHKDDELCLVV